MTMTKSQITRSIKSQYNGENAAEGNFSLKDWVNIKGGLFCSAILLNMIINIAPSAAQSNVASGSIDMATHLTPWQMFVSADIIVKIVMIGLLLASVATWTILVAKTIELNKAQSLNREAYIKLEQARNITHSATLVDKDAEATLAMVNAANLEIRKSVDATHDIEGLKERIASRLERIEDAAGRQMNKGTGALASIGSTAPFVGLFGTVWGIMNSFIGIAAKHTTNLAVVAPGIAEALLATAFGLIAAIPAVVIYNALARRISAYKALIADNSAAVLRLVSRDLSRGVDAKTELHIVE